MDAGSVLLSIAMVIGPVVGYFDQVRLIVQSKSSAGFNRTTCAILLFANILRIFFWFGKRFDMTLLLQSIVMILAQLGLLAIVVRYRQKGVYANLGEFSPSSLSLDEQLEAELEQQDGLPPQLSRDSLGDDDRPLHTLPFVRRWIVKFWSWDRYLDYVNFLLFFTTFVGLLYLIFHSSSVFIEILGMLSLGIESTLPLPQCISNVQRKSTEGFSHLVLATWFLGDSFKLFYFIYTQSPAQFVICGSVQLCIDLVIVGQFILYSTWFQGPAKSYVPPAELDIE